ncbi:MAG TPA: hypothetical protein VFJ43_07810, partial [Bacteroidia bacterium]|nr:hypothetical protein [Bacteroidia bacterium]
MEKKIIRIAIVFFAITGLSTIVSAQCTLDQNQPMNNGGTSERNLPGYYDWQSFTAGISGALCEVDVLYCNTNVHLAGSGILKIY